MTDDVSRLSSEQARERIVNIFKKYEEPLIPEKDGKFLYAISCRNFKVMIDEILALLAREGYIPSATLRTGKKPLDSASG